MTIKPVQDLELANKLYYMTLLEVFLIAFGFCFPLSFLVLVQTQNVLNNTTTNLRWSKRANKLDNVNNEASNDDKVAQLIAEQEEHLINMREFDS